MKTKTDFTQFYAVSILIVILLSFAACKEEPDIEAPSIPSGLSYTATTTSINLSWQTSTDNVKVVGYKIYRNNVLAGNSISTSFVDAGLSPNTIYEYSVSALDKAGNESGKSNPLKANTGDDCPTCSKWLSEASFLAPANIDEVFFGEEKSAGSLMLKNISAKKEMVNIALAFSNTVADAIESFSYTFGEEEKIVSLNAGKVFLSDIEVLGNSSLKVDLSFKVKDKIPSTVANNSQISLALTATTTSEVGVNQPGNGVFAGVDLGLLKAYTAKIDESQSYEASASAEEKVLFGNSVAKAFVLEVTTPGLVRFEVIGEKEDGSSPLKYFWVNAKDSEDFNISVSTLNPIIPKTPFGDKKYIEIELKAGTNVIAFKADSYKGQIANGKEVGLRIIGENFDLKNSHYTANSIADNVAGKIKVVGRIGVGAYVSPKTPQYGARWSDWFIYPQNEDGSYNKDAYPIIAGVGISFEHYAENYPKLYFEKSAVTPSGFDKEFKIYGADFGKDIDPNFGYFGTVFAESLPNNIVKYENNIVTFLGEPQKMSDLGTNYSAITMLFNVYNDDDITFRPKEGYVSLDPAPIGWKFIGNPELELWTEAEVKESKRIL